MFLHILLGDLYACPHFDFFFKKESGCISHSALKFTIESRPTSNTKSFCLGPPATGMTTTHHHIWLVCLLLRNTYSCSLPILKSHCLLFIVLFGFLKCPGHQPLAKHITCPLSVLLHWCFAVRVIPSAVWELVSLIQSHLPTLAFPVYTLGSYLERPCSDQCHEIHFPYVFF